MSLKNPTTLLAVNDVVFAEILAQIGHSQSEIDEVVPQYQKQFLSTFFFAVSAYLENDISAPFLERVKNGDLSSLVEMAELVSPDDLVGCYFYAFEEVYGSYSKEVLPLLTEEKKQQMLKDLEEDTK